MRLAAFALVVVFLGASSPALADELHEVEKAGTKAYLEKRWAECAGLKVREAALSTGRQKALAHYDAGCCYALAGKVDSAFAQVTAAVDGGYLERQHILEDEDLKSLRSDARWNEMLARLDAKVAADATGPFAGCSEVYVSPMFVAGKFPKIDGKHPHGRQGSVKVWASSTVPEGKRPVELGGAKGLESLFATTLGTLWPEPGEPGKWVPVAPKGSLFLEVVGTAGGKDYPLGRLEVLPSAGFSKNGFDAVEKRGEGIFSLQISRSATDGTRLCRGATPGALPTLMLPDYEATARPNRAMLAPRFKTLKCPASGGGRKECDPAEYFVDFGPLFRDGGVQAAIKFGTPFGARSEQATVSFWARTKEGRFQEAFAGECLGSTPALAGGVVLCATPGRDTVVELVEGKATQREAKGPQEIGRLKLWHGMEKVSEARATLPMLRTAQMAFKARYGEYARDFGALVGGAGLGVERGNHYSYFLAPKGRVQKRNAKELPKDGKWEILAADRWAHPGLAVAESLEAAGCRVTEAVTPDGKKVGVGVSGQVFVIAAAGNVDDDPGFDCWSISNVERVAADGRKILALEPFHELKDLENGPD